MKVKLRRVFSTGEVAKIVGGKVKGDPSIKFEFVATDTREDVKDALFIPIKGERFDGHDFIEDALRKGAKTTLSERPISTGIQVDSTICALGKLSRFVRDKWGGKVVAVAGSCGKTTTKDLVAHVLSKAGLHVSKSLGSFNNFIGLPLTLLPLDKEEVVVVEVGTSSRGEIEALSKLCRPDISIITVVGKEHLEGLGLEVFEEEFSLFENTKDTVIFRLGDPRFEKARNLRTRKLGFGFEGEKTFDFLDLTVIARNVKITHDGLEFLVGDRTFQFGLPIWHIIPSILASFCVLYAFGHKPISLDEISIMPHRFEIKKLRNGITLIDDSYNSNPTSLSASLTSLSKIKKEGRVFLVLGDMLELGEFAEDEHLACLKLANRMFPDAEIIAYGELMTKSAQKLGLGKCFEDIVETHRYLRKAKQGDIVFVKGSRKMELDRLCTMLEDA